jgi:tetratricopeptide (TPR) repeat protein
MKHILIIISLAFLFGLGACKSQKQSSTRPVTQQKLREVSQIEQLESTARLIEGSKQSMLGNYSSAILHFAEAVKIDPRNSAALYELAKLHAQQGFARDAEIFALQAVLLDPDNKYFNMALADIYFIQNKNEQGLKVQESLAKKFPADLNIQISKLSSLIYLKKYDEAITHFEYIERVNGFNNEFSLQKQKLLMEMNKPDLALKEAKRLVSFFPQEVMYLELLADLYSENNQEEEAYKIYQQMIEIQPDNPMAHLLLADYYRNKENEEKSFTHLRKAFSSPQLGIDGKSRIMASYYHLSMNDTLLALQADTLCVILIEMHPEEAQAHAIYGDFLYRDNKLEQAWDKYFAAATLNPSELGYWQQLLSIEAKMEDYESMLNTSSKALEYFFEHPVLFYFNGLANLQAKNYPQAINAFKSGRDLSIDEPELMGQFLIILADTYFKVNDKEKAYYHYEEALSLDPDNAYALNNYSYYMSTSNGNLQKALQMSAKSLELQPDNASFQDTYGWIKYKLGDYQQAQIWIKKALENTEEPSAVLLEHYGDVMYKLGKKDDALSYWKKALDLVDSEKDADDVSEFLHQKVKEGKLFE